LSLARWDEAQSKWSVLKTKVNAEAMTLSTSTNQLSIWAVVVGPASGTVNLWLIIGGAAGVVVIVLLVYFLAVRRRSANK
jgi:heme/copper-type cytochrome/quinol oxidase subunit 4